MTWLDPAGVPSLLLTGPSSERAEWLEAVRAAGWTAIDWPLIQLESLEVDITLEIDGLPDWLCMTSPNALSAVEAALSRLPELRSVPVALVGERSAKRAERLGLRLGLPPAQSASDLCEALLAEIGDGSAGMKILWPRGSLAEELSASLRAAGLEVLDPIVYRSVHVEHEEAPALTDGIFFASPSAVRAWLARAAPEASAPPVTASPQPVIASAQPVIASAQPVIASAQLAIAIGATTAACLHDEAGTLFRAIQSLESPSPEALAKTLAGLLSRPSDSSPSTDEPDN